MGAEVIVALVTALINSAMQIWSSARKVYGEEAIPSWDEILKKNADLQAKIDAEL